MALSPGRAQPRPKGAEEGPECGGAAADEGRSWPLCSAPYTRIYTYERTLMHMRACGVERCWRSRFRAGMSRFESTSPDAGAAREVAQGGPTKGGPASGGPALKAPSAPSASPLASGRGRTFRERRAGGQREPRKEQVAAAELRHRKTLAPAHGCGAGMLTVTAMRDSDSLGRPACSAARGRHARSGTR